MFNSQFDSIVTTETWINNEYDYKYLSLPRYKCKFSVREGRRGDVAMFIKNNLIYKRNNNVKLIEAESVFIELPS